jgi:hypothetical protein
MFVIGIFIWRGYFIIYKIIFVVDIW